MITNTDCMIDYKMKQIITGLFYPDNYAAQAVLLNTIQILTSTRSSLKPRALALGYCTWFQLSGTV